MQITTLTKEALDSYCAKFPNDLNAPYVLPCPKDIDLISENLSLIKSYYTSETIF